MKKLIALDGPAGSGKSSISKAVAERLNYNYLDTGAMYRACTLYVLENNIDPKNENDVSKIISDIRIDLENGKVFLNRRDVTKEIRSKEVTQNVSYVCAYKAIREEMVSQQRWLAKHSNTGIILDGRDIGTVVFPNADLKIYLTASYEKRAERRMLDNKKIGIIMSKEETLEDLKRRDFLDSTRENSPLRKADDAIEIDNSNITLEETISLIIKLIKEQ